MMNRQATKSHAPSADATVGFGVTPDGEGVAYARVTLGESEHILRVPFRVGRMSGLQSREAAYAALTVVSRGLGKRGIRKVRFHMSDAGLIDELEHRRDVPPPIVLANLRLRCALNALDGARVEWAPDTDLTERARAEVFLHAAA